MPARWSRRGTVCALIVAALAVAAPGTAHAAPPSCDDLDFSTPPEQAASIFPGCTDEDFDLLTYAIGTQPENGTAEVVFGLLEYTPDDGFQGTDTFTYTATDGIESSLPATVTVEVVNHAPECFGQTMQLRTGKPLTTFYSCNDEDGQTLTHSIVDPPDHGGATIGADGFTYTPAAGFTGADHFTIKAFDGFDESAPARIDLDVTPNHAPTCNTFTTHTGVGEELELDLFCSDPDWQDSGDLTYALTAPDPEHGTISGFQQGLGSATLTYTPAAGFTGADTFGFTASDGDITTDATQRIHVSDQPLCAPLPARTIRPNRSFTATLDCTRPPGDFGSLTYSVVTPQTKGTLENFGFGILTYAANPAASGADSFQVQATSETTGASNVVTQQITIDANANEAPTCFDTTPLIVYSARETGVSPPCDDPDFDPLTVAALGTPAHGTLSVEGGLLIYTADAGYVGLDTIAFTVSDGRADPVASSVEVDVRAPQPPTCEAIPALQVRPGTSKGFVLECFNPQNDPQEYAVVAAPTGGSVEVDEFGDGTYTADAGPDGSDTFTLQASNAAGTSAPVSVNVTISDSANSAPQCFSNGFNPYKVVTATATTLPLGDLCDDADGDPLLFTRLAEPTNGSVPAGPAASLTYTSDAGHLGPDTFTFIATDDRGAVSDEVTFAVDVRTSVEPTCTPQAAVTLRPARSRTVFLDCQDPNFEPVTYEIVTGPAKGTLSPPGSSTFGARTYTATTAASGETDSFTYRASSVGGTSANHTQTFNINSAANDPPTCFSSPAFPRDVPSGRASELHGLCFDPDNDPLTYTVLSDPDHGAVTVSAGVLVYTPDAGHTGPDEFNFSVSDGHGGSVALATQHLNVTVPQPPVCGTFPGVAVRTNSPGRTINTPCSSGPFDELIYVLDAGPQNGTLQHPGGPTSPSWVYVPETGFTGADSFTWHAENEEGSSAQRTQVINVSDDANTAPICPPTVGLTARPGIARSLFMPCFDPDSDTLTPSPTDQPDHGTLNTASNPWTYTATPGYTGPDSFAVSVADGHGGSTTVTVNVTVTNANTPPTCFGTSIVVQAGTTHQFLSAPCSDPDGDVVTLSVVDQPDHGTVGLSPTGFPTYTPDAGYTGPDSFTFKGNDGTADSAVATVGITVTAAAGPTCANLDAATVPNEPVELQLDCFVPGGGNPAYAIVAGPSAAQGTLGPIDQTTGTVTFTPAAGFTGTATFTYRATAGGQQSAPATATIDVSTREFAPVVWLDASTTTPRTGKDVTFSAFAYDPDGGAIATYEWFVDGVEVAGANGDELVRQFATEGDHSVRVEVTDGDGDTASDELTIDAHATNAGPEVYLELERERAAVGAAVGMSAYSFDPDGEVARLDWEIDGTPVAVPGEDFDFREESFDTAGTKTISVTATDDEGETATETATLEVTDENTPPEPDVGWWPAPAKQGQLTHFNVFGEDAEGDAITKYEWDFGDDGTFEIANDQFPEHTFTARGDKRIRVRLTDERGEVGTATVTVNVVNSPPVARITGPSAVDKNSTASFSDASTDANGTIASREWDLDGDGAYDDGTAVQVPFQAGATVGAKVVRLRVTDNEGETSTATKTVTVREPQDAAIGDVEPPAGGPPISITTTVNPQTGTTTIVIPQGQAGQFPNGCVPLDITVALKTAAGASVLRATLVLTPNGGSAQQSFTMTDAGGGNWTAHIDCAVPGTMKVVYDVLEQDGDEVTFERDVGTITLIDPQGIVHDRAAYDAALAAFGPTPTEQQKAAARDEAAIEGATVVLERLVGGDWQEVSPSDPGIEPNVNPQVTGPNGLYQWDVSAGTYRVKVSAPGYEPVTSDAQVIPPPVLDLHIPLERNQAPVASVAGSKPSVARGEAVTFTLTDDDADGDVVSRQWDLDGDGQFDDANGPSAQRAYGTPGTRTVKARVTDDDGDSTVATTTVIVLNRAPTAAIGGPAGGIAGAPVALTGTEADPDGNATIRSRAWDTDNDGAFDDASGPSASPSFATPGAKIVRFRVTDDAGATATATKTLTIAPRPAGGGGGGGGGGGSGGGGPAPDTAAPELTLGALSGQKIKQARNGVKIGLTSDEPCSVAIVLTLDKKTAKKLKLGKKAITVATATATLSAGTTTVKVKPNAKGRKALKKAKKLKKLKLGLKLTGTDAQGNAVTQTAKLTLKR